jgi:hypothetical protein
MLPGGKSSPPPPRRRAGEACPEDVRGFQLHLASSGAGTPKINATVAALRFFFKVTLDRPDLSRHLSTIHEPRKVPVVLSPDEVARFLEAAPGIKYKARCSLPIEADQRGIVVSGLPVHHYRHHPIRIFDHIKASQSE